MRGSGRTALATQPAETASLVCKEMLESRLLVDLFCFLKQYRVRTLHQPTGHESETLFNAKTCFGHKNKSALMIHSIGGGVGVSSEISRLLSTLGMKCGSLKQDRE